MTGVVVCHGSAGVRDRIIAAAHGVPNLTPARAAATAEELVALVRRAAPALVLVDARLPGVGAIEALRRIRGLGSDATIVMLAVPGDEITLDRAIALGARGYLPPDLDRSELAAVASHGLSSIPQQITSTNAGNGAQPAGSEKARSGSADLTRRELEVLAGMSYGRSNAQIGAELYLSEDTVKTHARRLFRKLGASDRAQAVAIGLRTGLIT
jgi:two-component system, NarL family, nitrate/nitrite response regulator NarL